MIRKTAAIVFIIGIIALAAQTFNVITSPNSSYIFSIPSIFSLWFSINGLFTVWLPTILVFGVAALAEYRFHQSQQESAQRAYIAAIDRINDWLEGVVEKLFQNEDTSKIRANIMREDKGLLRVICDCNMEPSPDKLLTWKRKQGVCGVAWDRALDMENIEDRRAPVVFFRDRTSEAQLKSIWRLSDDHIEKTKILEWIVSIPVFNNPDNAIGFEAILNFDGLNSSLSNVDRLDEKNLNQEFIEWAVLASRRMKERGLI